MAGIALRLRLQDLLDPEVDVDGLAEHRGERRDALGERQRAVEGPDLVEGEERRDLGPAAGLDVLAQPVGEVAQVVDAGVPGRPRRRLRRAAVGRAIVC